MQVRNERYWKSFATFFRRLVDHLSECEEQSLPLEYDLVLRFDDEGNPHPRIEKVIDFIKLTEDLLSTYQDWPEFAELRRHAIVVDAAGQIIRDKNFALECNFIPRVLHKFYSEPEKAFRYDDRAVEAQYELIENAIYEDTWTYSVWTPVFNLELDADLIQLDTGLVVRRVTPADHMMLFDLEKTFQEYGLCCYSGFARTMLSTEVSAKKGAPGRIPPKGTRELFESAVASLSLFKRTPVYFGAICRTAKSFWTSYEGIFFAGLGCYHRDPFRKPAVLGRTEIPAYQALWTSLRQGLDSHPWLGVACERLCEYFARSHFQWLDQIIDLMTIFEILYLPGRGSEVKFRLAVRCATVLGKSKERRQHIFQVVSLAYDIRSDIMHSGKIGKGSTKTMKRLGTSPLQLAQILETYLYEASAFSLRTQPREKKTP